MESIRAFSPLAFAFLLFGRILTPNSGLPLLSSEQPREENVRSWLIVLPKSIDTEPEVYEIGRLEEGESRQFLTSEGDEITVERERSGRTIKLNGKAIQTHVHHGAYDITTHIGGEHELVRLHKEYEAAAEAHSEHHEEGDSGHHMIVSIEKHDRSPEMRVNTLSTAGDSPQIIIIDRVRIEKEEE